MNASGNWNRIAQASAYRHTRVFRSTRFAFKSNFIFIAQNDSRFRSVSRKEIFADEILMLIQMKCERIKSFGEKRTQYVSFTRL